MRATLMYAAGEVRIENVPDPRIDEPTDAIIRVVRASICGSDLWPYNDMPTSETGRPMGHEAIGVVEDVGAEVRNIKPGDLVVMPFAFSTAPALSAARDCMLHGHGRMAPRRCACEARSQPLPASRARLGVARPAHARHLRGARRVTEIARALGAEIGSNFRLVTA